MKSHYVVNGKDIIVHCSDGDKYPRLSYSGKDFACCNCHSQIPNGFIVLFLGSDYHLCYDCFKDEIKIKINVEKFLNERWSE